MSTDTTKGTQTQALLALLRERGEQGITPLEALELIGSFRLGARIWDLKQPENGSHTIRADRVTLPNGKSVARYVLVEQVEPTAPEPTAPRASAEAGGVIIKTRWHSLHGKYLATTVIDGKAKYRYGATPDEAERRLRDHLAEGQLQAGL